MSTSEGSASPSPELEETEKISGSSTSSIPNSININEPFEESGYCDFGDLDPSSEELYEKSELSISQSLAILFNWFCSYPNISKESFSRLLYLLNSVLLPKGNKLTNSYTRARSMIKNSLVPITTYDCCSNDCIIFHNKTKDYDVCPKCDASRYLPCTTIARKQFKYIPISPKLKRMYADRRVSELLQSHSKLETSSVISDLHQSDAWKLQYATDGPFQGDLCGISLSLCTDT